MLPSLTRATVAMLVVVGGLAGCGGSGKSSSSASSPPPSSSNPVPTVTSISPTTAVAGSSGLTLTVTGTNFVATSVLNWNGSPRTTTFVSATQITGEIPAADIASVGSASVTVVTPAPGGGTSAESTFTITALNPVPTLTSVSPPTATPGSGGLTLTATGTNFTATSVLNWNGSPRATTFVSATQLTAQIPSADIATGGTASVTIVTPAPGGGTSAAMTFTITAVNASVQQVAPGGTSSSSEHYHLVGTVAPPVSSTASKSEHYQLQGGLTGAGLNIR